MPADAPPPEYAVLGPLGGQGRAFRALHRPSGTEVHLKKCRDRRAGLREARLLKRVCGPWTPSLIGLHCRDDAYWIATLWIDGQPLDDQTLPARIGPWATSLARAICHIHRWGVVHGDLKPANVILTADDRVRLVDFDFASRTGEGAGPEQAGGTFGYVAPERLTGWPADPRSDLWSLGATLRASGADEPGLMPFLDDLRRERPSERPARTDAVVSTLAESLGRGSVPRPDLAWTGWRAGTTTLDRLAVGVEAVLGVDAVVAARVARTILEDTGGTHAAASDLWRHWLPRVTDDPWQPIDPDVVTSRVADIHALARDAARRWIGGLPPESRRYARRLAYLGRSIPSVHLDRPLSAALAAIGETPPPDRDVLEAALTPIQTTEGPDHESRRSFATPALWEVLNAEPADDAFVHAIATEFDRTLDLAGSPADDLLQLANLLHLAGDTARARELWFEGGERLLAEERIVDASHAYESAWRTLSPDTLDSGIPHPPDAAALGSLPPDARRRYISRFVTGLCERGILADAAIWAEAPAALEMSPLDRVEYHLTRSSIAFRHRDVDAQLAETDAGLAHCGDDLRARGRLLHRKATAVIETAGGPAQTLALAGDALSAARAAGDARLEADVLNIMGVAHIIAGRHVNAREPLEQVLAIARREGWTVLVARALTNLSAVEQSLGDLESAATRAREVREVSRANHHRSLESASLDHLSRLAYAEGDWDRATGYIRMAAAIALEDQDVRRVAQSMRFEISVLTRAGRIPESERLVERAIALAKRAELDRVRVELQVLAWGSRVRDREIALPEAAADRLLADTREYLSEQDTVWVSGVHALNALLLGRDPDRVLDACTAIEAPAVLQHWLALVRAHAHAAAGRHRDAVESARDAIAMTDVETEPPAIVESNRALCRFHEGRFLMQVDRREAHAVLLEARDCARRTRNRWVEVLALRWLRRVVES